MRSILPSLAAGAYFLAAAAAPVAADYRLTMPAPWKTYEQRTETAIKRMHLCERPACPAEMIVEVSLIPSPSGQSCPDCPASTWENGIRGMLAGDGIEVVLLGSYDKSVEGDDQHFFGEFVTRSKDSVRFVSNRVIVRNREVLLINARCDEADSDHCRNAMKQIADDLELMPEQP